MEFRKPALRLDQQLDLLSERGLVIEDATATRRYLECVGYYRLMGYLFPLRIVGSDAFAAGARADEAIALYDVDHHLRCLLLDAIGHIEVALRTSVTYELAHGYGAFGHYEARSFARDRSWHEAWVNIVDSEVDRGRETFLDHFKNNYQGFPRVPVWMATEVMSFGCVSRMFGAMHAADQKAIARRFVVASPVLISWMHSILVVRNICAHHGRMWNRVLGVRPMRPRAEPWVRHGHHLPNDKLFYLLVILRHLLRATPAAVSAWQRSVEQVLDPIMSQPWMRDSAGIPDEGFSHRLWAG